MIPASDVVLITYIIPSKYSALIPRWLFGTPNLKTIPDQAVFISMRKPIWNLLLALVATLVTGPAMAQSFSPYSYDIGSPNVRDVYINPLTGSDDSNGTSPSTAWRTVTKAWQSIPNNETLTQGIRINLMPGTYGTEHLPNFWDLKRGTFTAPIILQAAEGQGTVLFTRDINMKDVSYFYLLNVNITPAPAGDAFHGEATSYILLRGNIFNGGSTEGGAHETVKFNQSQYIYIENNDISFADDNNVDLVAVQYGHMIGNKIHKAQDWCAYAKGGSAYFRVESNEFYDCGVGGFTAGQGSGGEFMISPWIHYEAYDIKVINNKVHDVIGAAFGVNGGYNILIAHNTAYRIGRRSHMLEVVYGERSCDGADVAACAAYNAAGGWIPARRAESGSPIGDKNVFILNNIFYNPAGSQASPQHFSIQGPRIPDAGNNLSSPQRTDNNLVIRGNIVWNGTTSTPLGIEDSEACAAGNPTCTAELLRAQNEINSVEPQFIALATGDIRPLAGGNLFGRTIAELASFTGGDRVATPLAPEGNLLNLFTRDFSGATFSPLTVPGAFQSSSSVIVPPVIDDTPPPGSEPPPSGTGEAPVVQIESLKAKVSGKKLSVTVAATITDADSDLSSVAVTVQSPKKSVQGVLTLTRGKYTGTFKIAGKKGTKITATVTATDAAAHSTTAEKTAKGK